MRRSHLPAVARLAGVSTDFLYNHRELRELIERQRTASRGVRSPTTDPPLEEVNTTSSAVRALSRKLAELRTTYRQETTRLGKALAAAQGENLELRRRLALRTSPNGPPFGQSCRART